MGNGIWNDKEFTRVVGEQTTYVSEKHIVLEFDAALFESVTNFFNGQTTDQPEIDLVALQIKSFLPGDSVLEKIVDDFIDKSLLDWTVSVGVDRQRNRQCCYLELVSASEITQQAYKETLEGVDILHPLSVA